MNKDENKGIEFTEDSKIVAAKIVHQSKQLEAYHKKVKETFPTNYLEVMQPYVNLIVGYKKKNKIKNNMLAAIDLAGEEKNPQKKIFLLATAVEMTINEK